MGLSAIMTQAKTGARFSPNVISGIAETTWRQQRNLPSFAGLPSTRAMPDRDVFYAWRAVALAKAGRSSHSLHCISLAPARLDRCPCGFTGHVALPIRSIALAQEAGEDRVYGTQQRQRQR